MRNLGARGCGGGNPAWYAKKCEQIEELLAKGLSYKEIANKLKIELAFVMQLAKSRRIMKPVNIFDDGSDIYVIIDNGKSNNKEEKEMKKVSRKKKSTTRARVEEEKKSIEEVVFEDSEKNDTIETPKKDLKEEPIVEDESVVEMETKVIKSNDDFTDFHKMFNLDTIENIFDSKNTDGVVEAGLIGDRHDMPVDKFIFPYSLKSKEMFDYAFQEKVCKDFIVDYLPKVLVVYVTGLQMVLASLIKVCYNTGVPLVLKHYNSETTKYEEQNISAPEDFKMIQYLKNKSNKGLFFYKSSAEDYTAGAISNCYFITLAKEDGDIITDRAGILCKNFSDIWEIYPRFIESINNHKELPLAVFVANGNIDKTGNFTFGNSITKGYNFK